MEPVNCFPCRNPADYDAGSYKWFKSTDQLCPSCLEIGNKLIQAEPKTYTIKTKPAAKPFLPPIVKEERSFYEKERPDNDGSMIE
jgi:hypothetical protein